MHTTELPSGAKSHHNGDYSGDIHVFALSAEDPSSGKMVEVLMLIDDFKTIIADMVRSKRLSEIEAMSEDELVGLVKHD